MPVFENSEYESRIAKVKQRMAAQGIDVLLATHPANMNYLTGYDGWSFYVHQLVALSQDADQPIWIGREMDARGAQLTAFIKDENIRPYTDEYVDATDKHCMHFVADVLKELGWNKGNVGVEMDAYYFTARAYVELVEKLPEANIVDAHPLVNWVRIVKSPAEVELMRAAGKIVERAMQVGIDTIEPGVRECDAIAKIYEAQISGTPEFWGDYAAAVPQAMTGIKTTAAHLTWTGEHYGPDSSTNLELGGCHKRYHSALARTLYLGDPPEKLIDLAKVTAEGQEAGLEAARAGNTCHDIEAAWRAVITRAGYEKRSRIGYSIGINYPPNWGEHTASLREGDMTVLAPNMCFHMIMGMWMKDIGFYLSETFRITEDGAPEAFADVPRQLFVKN